jgi:hypothetical protein
MSIFTKHLSASHGAQVTGSLRLTDSNVTGEPNHLNFIRDDTSIVGGENIGKVIFSGRTGGPAIPGQDFMIGAAIAATASDDWYANHLQSTDLKFWVQTNETSVNQLAAGAILTLSGAMTAEGKLRAEFIGDVFAGNDMYAKSKLQVGVSTDGAVADNAYYPLRISAATGDVGIEIDAGSDSDTASVLFNAAGSSKTGRPGIFCQPSSDADLSIRNEGTAQESGAIMVGHNMNSVRIGGGQFGMDGYDPLAALVVSASANNRKSWVMLRSRHNTATIDNIPILTFDFKSTAGSANTGAWHTAVSPHGAKPLRITAASYGSNVKADHTAAMTFGRGGEFASIGVGGQGSTWPGVTLPRSMDPTGSFHIEHMNGTIDELSADLTKTNLLLGNSYEGGNSPVFSRIAFDISTDSNLLKHTANITVAKEAAGKGIMSFRMSDESSNNNSTRPRVRIDGQGGIIMLSGSTLSGTPANGWPNANHTGYAVGSKMPSGSLTLVANKPGGAWNPPTLNLVTWGLNGHAGAPIISQFDSLGRIQFWSSDGQISNESERVGAYIEATAASDHDGSVLSPTDINIYTRAASATSPARILKIGSDGKVYATGDVDVGNDLIIRGDVIKDSGDIAAITFDGSQNAELGGDITAPGLLTLTKTGESIRLGNNSANNVQIFFHHATAASVMGVFNTDQKFAINVGNSAFTATNSLELSTAGGLAIKASITSGGGVIVNGGTLDVNGTEPTITIGDGGAEDTKIQFDGNAQDYYIALDDSADQLLIGCGNVVGGNRAIKIDSAENVTIGQDDGNLYVKGTTYTGENVKSSAQTTVNFLDISGTHTYNASFYGLTSIQGGGQVEVPINSSATALNTTDWTIVANFSTAYGSQVFEYGAVSSFTHNGRIKWSAANTNTLTHDTGIKAGTYYYRVNLGAEGEMEQSDKVIIEYSSNNGGTWAVSQTLTMTDNDPGGAVDGAWTGLATQIPPIDGNGISPAVLLSSFLFTDIITFTGVTSTDNLFRFRRENGSSAEFLHISEFEMSQANDNSRDGALDMIASRGGPDYRAVFFQRFFELDNPFPIGQITMTDGSVSYTEFTGGHSGVLPPAELEVLRKWDIIKVTNQERTFGEPVYDIEGTSVAQDKAVIGVYGGSHSGIAAEVNSAILAVGNGWVRICDQNGNIEIGDYICSSDRKGEGMKQTSAQMMNYTVAKCTNSVDWSLEPGTLGQKSKVVSCTYHCG